MGWIEILKIQTVSKSAADKCSSYLCDLGNHQSTSDDPKISTYSNSSSSLSYPTLHMIMLAWSANQQELSVSPRASLFIHELEDFGLVDHSRWMCLGNKGNDDQSVAWKNNET